MSLVPGPFEIEDGFDPFYVLGLVLIPALTLAFLPTAIVFGYKWIADTREEITDGLVTSMLVGTGYAVITVILGILTAFGFQTQALEAGWPWVWGVSVVVVIFGIMYHLLAKTKHVGNGEDREADSDGPMDISDQSGKPDKEISPEARDQAYAENAKYEDRAEYRYSSDGLQNRY